MTLAYRDLIIQGRALFVLLHHEISSELLPGVNAYLRPRPGAAVREGRL